MHCSAAMAGASGVATAAADGDARLSCCSARALENAERSHAAMRGVALSVTRILVARGIRSVLPYVVSYSMTYMCRMYAQTFACKP